MCIILIVCPAISARKLAEVAGHGILIVLGGGDVASQCVSKFSCCRDLHPGRQIGSLSSSNVEKTHVFITLPSTNFRTIWLYNLVTHLQIYLGNLFRISRSPVSASQSRFLWSRPLRPKVTTWMRAGNFLKTFGKNRFSVKALGLAPDWPVLRTRTYDTFTYKRSQARRGRRTWHIQIGLRGLPTVIDHTLHLNTSQNTLIAGICTRVARLEV